MSKNKVTCDVCGEQYDPVFEYSTETNQGIDCASFITSEGIYGCYGSAEIDLEYWVWKNEMPELIKSVFNGVENTICDKCIRLFKNNEDIVYSRTRG